METLKKIVSNQYFPAAAVLTAVLLFWTIAMFGGLSLLHNNQPPMATLTWMLFVYAAAVLTPLAGIIAAADLVRRWRRDRHYAQAEGEQDELAYAELPSEDSSADEPLQGEEPDEPYPGVEASRQEAPRTEATPHEPPTQPVTYRPAAHQSAKNRPAQAKQRKNAA